jgi:hypothetical protein
MENRSGLVVAAKVTLATSTGEREAAACLSEQLPEGAPRDAMPQEITANTGYALSRRLRKWVEDIVGWRKAVGVLAQLKVHGLQVVRAVFVFTAAAHNLVRLRIFWTRQKTGRHRGSASCSLKRWGNSFGLAQHSRNHPSSGREIFARTQKQRART